MYSSHICSFLNMSWLFSPMWENRLLGSLLTTPDYGKLSSLKFYVLKLKTRVPFFFFTIISSPFHSHPFLYYFSIFAVNKNTVRNTPTVSCNYS